MPILTSIPEMNPPRHQEALNGPAYPRNRPYAATQRKRRLPYTVATPMPAMSAERTKSGMIMVVVVRIERNGRSGLAEQFR